MVSPVQPPLATFEQTYAGGRSQVMWYVLAADLLTPVAAMLKLAGGRPNAFLLESVEGGAFRGRYSIIGVDPDLIWRCQGDAAWINRQAATDAAAFIPCPVAERGGAIASLRALHAETRIDLPARLPPMAAGLVGYLAYDVVRNVERLPTVNPDVLGVPDGLFVRPTVVAVFDTVEDTVTIITPVRPAADGVPAATAYALAEERIAVAVARLEAPLPAGPAVPDAARTAIAAPVSNIGRDAYLRMVEKAKTYIAAGDIFQVVPSQRFSTPFPLPPFSLYRALRRLNPSPFLFFLDFGAFQVVGSSPEILVRVRGGKVTIRPIAGTRRRGATPEEDRDLAAELLADPKERAEHLMLLDLGRNDVGRVARIGSVRVTERMVVETYSHVMHLVSNVEGELDERFDGIDALLAGFPAGTVSGAPKVRAMEIIEELEPDRRGIYGGCIGYLGATGEVDTCIALRTAIIKDGVLMVQAGGGVVADSDPAAEYEETCNKARALLRAAEEAGSYA